MAGILSTPIGAVLFCVGAECQPILPPETVCVVPDGAVQIELGIAERSYPINDILGPFVPPATETFPAKTTVNKIKYSAHRTHNNVDFLEKQLGDWQIIDDTFPAAAFNTSFLTYYFSNGTNLAEYGKTSVEHSWKQYNNWLLGIDDNTAYWTTRTVGWDGTEAGFRDYEQWYNDYKKADVEAVPASVVP